MKAKAAQLDHLDGTHEMDGTSALVVWETMARRSRSRSRMDCCWTDNWEFVEW